MDKVKRCKCWTSDGQVYWVGGPYESWSCKEYEAWEWEMGRKVWCYEDREEV